MMLSKKNRILDMIVYTVHGWMAIICSKKKNICLAQLKTLILVSRVNNTSSGLKYKKRFFF